jgi:tetraacyldisaccharide 4'-kinase
MKIFLIPLSYLFRIIVFIRNLFYDMGFLRTIELECAVLSVGNIAAGGTGKTPFVELIARHILNKGRFVVILMKGYKREHDDIKVVELGFENTKGELNSENLGDEAFLLLENLSDMGSTKGLVVVGDDKTKTAKFASSKFKPELIIIDDGYQHRKLQRDLDVVIINPHSDRYLIPAGNLREPMKNISRSDLVIVNQKFDKNAIAENTKQKPKVTCEYEFDSFCNLKNEKLQVTEDEAIAFCGIAEPESFRKLLESMGVKLKVFIKFPDHHSFTNDEISKITDSFQKSGAKFILTTQKDFVRIKNSELVLNAAGENQYKNFLYNYPLYYAKIKMQITQNSELLYKEIDNLLDSI